MFDPNTGRFLSMDPISASGVDVLYEHPFAYAQNNPVNRIDASGLCSDDYEFPKDVVSVLVMASDAMVEKEPGKQVEYGGMIICDKAGKIIKFQRPLAGTTSSWPRDITKDWVYPGPGERYHGMYHTHPRYNNTPTRSFSNPDVADLANRSGLELLGFTTSYVVAGDCIYVLTVEDKQKAKSCTDATVLERLRLRLADGFTNPDGLTGAAKDTALYDYSICMLATLCGRKLTPKAGQEKGQR